MVTTTNNNLYDLLGVSEQASQDEIRKTYLELARKYHPDKTGGDEAAEEKLKKINAAYDILKNEEKRKKYDQERRFGGFEGGYNTGDASEFSDIFSSIFGGGPQAQTRAYSNARTGRSLEARVSVALQDLIVGTSKTLRIRRRETCTECAGSGAAPGTSPVTCTDCQGAGQITQGNGFFSMARTCPRCHGTGETIASPCTTCSGSGQTQGTRQISVDIPAGVEEGTRLRVGGEGDAGVNGGPRGDLYVHIDVQSDPFFTREGTNIVCEVPITFAEAALGGEIAAPTLTGVAKVTVQPGTQTGSRLRMREMGLPKLGGGKRGDEFIKVLVEVPRKLTRDQKKLLREFDGDYAAKSHPLRDAFARLLEQFRKVF